MLTVVAEDVGDGGGPGSVPFIDTFPIYATDLRFDMNVRFRTKQNRAVEYYLRKDIENRRWREITMRRITVATNTTTTVNLGGIQRAEFLLAESDEAVQFGIGNASVNLYPASKAVALVVSDFERLDIKNPSTTAEATVLLVVTD